MKTIYLTGYKCHNLGDDLFFLQIIERYPSTRFVFEDTNDGYYKGLMSKYNNVNIIKPIEPPLWGRIINKILLLLGFEKKDFLFPLLRRATKIKADAIVMIGGSVFIEPRTHKTRSEKLVRLMLDYFDQAPLLCIGANFGPYNSNKYLKSSKRRISLCTDVCFRDKYSYDLFANLNSVRYAPDILFGYKPRYAYSIDTKSIGISLIDLSNRKDLSHFKDRYLGSIACYINHNKFDKIVLLDFCEAEGDIKAINELIELFSDDRKILVEVVRYQCNPDLFMESFAKVETIIATRFHAMILSLVMGKITIPISYSKKIVNVINDMLNPIDYVDMREISELKLKDTIEHYKKPDISGLINLSQSQFQVLDNLLK